MKKDLENPIKLENGRMNPTLFYPPAALLCPSEALCVGGCGGGRLWKKSLMRWEFPVASF